MKITMLFLIAVVLLISTFTAVAQTRPADTLVAGGWEPRYAGLLQVPVLLSNTETAVALNTKICFDKKIFVKGSTGSTVADMYIYINTTDGITGVLQGRPGTLGDGSFNIEDRHFRLMVTGLKGNVYHFYNDQRNGTIKHYVSTGKTETFLYQFNNPQNDVIYRKAEAEFYCGGKFKAMAYKAGAAAPALFLFGQAYPPKLVTKKFIGHSGVGYLQTDIGTYMCLEMNAGTSFFEAREWDDVDVCFDPADFAIAEDEMYNSATHAIGQKKEKLDGKTFSGPCAGAEQELNEAKKRNLEKQKQLLEQSRSGNVYQNPQVQKAYIDMQDPVEDLKIGIMQEAVKICKLQQQLANTSSSSTRQSLQEKLNCRSQAKAGMEALIPQMESLGNRYRQNPAQAVMEKRKLLAQQLSTHRCN